MPTGNSYPAPNLPLTGTEQVTIYQQQGGIVTTCTATVFQIWSSAPLNIADYAYAALPAAVNYNLGALVFCTNGRNTGEAANAGTGCPVFVKSVSGTKTWCAVWSGVAVTI
jgi:hypothetical protein